MVMLEGSFIFLDRMTLDGEQQLWASGIADWDAFLARKSIAGISPKRKLFYDRQLRMMRRFLRRRDFATIAQWLPPSEHWRLYDLLHASAVALDIETSGYYGDITVIGFHAGGETRFLIQNKNLHALELERAFRGRELLLSFNGSSFDLPVIRRRFPKFRLHMPHIDLRHVAARLGLTGGLKTIELVLGLKRAEEIDGMDGSAAIFLWSLYANEDDDEALELLLEYNRADTENLVRIADLLIPQLWADLRKILKPVPLAG